MDRATSERPTSSSPGMLSRGKSRGEGSKPANRQRRLVFWAMSAPVCAVPTRVGVRRPRRGQGVACVSGQPEKDYDILMVNMDSDPIAELAMHGLKPIKMEGRSARQKFKGLGGSRPESRQKWIIPAGIRKKHALQKYYEIPGDTVGLTSRKDLAEWKASLYMREGGHWADFQELAVHGKELVKLPGGHAGLDLFDCDLESHESEPLFERFRVGEAQLEPEAFLVAGALQVFVPGFQAKDRADSRVAEALKNGGKGIFRKGTLKRIDKLMKGMGDRVGDLIEEFRPRACRGGSRLSWWLDRACDESNERADAVGRGALLSRASAWRGDLGRTLASAGTRELARRTDLKKLGIGDDVAKVPDQQTMRTVVKEFKLRQDLIDVRVLSQNEAVPQPRGAVRRIYATCTDQGVLADFSDAYADDPSFATVELATRRPTGTVVAVYAKEPKVQTSFPLRRYPYSVADQKHSSTTTAKLAQHIEIYIATWDALRKLHLDQNDPVAHALKRRLKSYGVSQKAPDAVDELDCVVCKELGRPNATRSANLKLSTEFSANAFLDAAEALYSDAAKGRVTQRFAEICEKYNILMRPVPAQAPWLKRAIDSFKDHFQRLNRDVQLTKSDDPSVWTSARASTRNNRIRRSGFTPYQDVLGRSPNVQALLIEAMEGPSRFAPAAARRAFFELDSDDAVRRATAGRVRPPRGPFVPGQLVFYWREVKHAKSKRLHGEHGRRGLAVVLAAEGRAGLRLSYRGVPVLASPEQVRHASRGEAGAVKNEDLVRWGTHLNLERYPKYHHYLEMDTTCRTSKLNRYVEMDMIEGDRLDDEVLSLKVKNRARGEFVARRTETTKKQKRETAFEASDLEEWRKWIQYDAVEWPSEEELAGVEKADILPMRCVRTDKNEPTRGSLSCEQHPLKAKSRNIVLGYKDKHLLAGDLQTNAPTLADTAAAVIIQEAASQPGGGFELGVVDSAFLNGRYLDSSRLGFATATKVQDLLDYNKLVSDAKLDHLDITFQKLDMDNAIVVAVGDSCHGNVGKTKTASKAGLVILLADNTDEQFLRGRPAVESGDMLQHLVELHYRLGRAHMDDGKAIEVVEVTDCKSLYDLHQKRGVVPSEKRLLIDIESFRNDSEFNNVVSNWVNAKQMLADCLTKQDIRAGDHMRHYLRWRMILGQREDDVDCEKLEDMIDWSGLVQVAKRRRIPTHVRKLLTIYAPTQEAPERDEKYFAEKHILKKTGMTEDIEHHEDTNDMSDAGLLVESDENQNTDGTSDLDDAREIYAMDAAGAEAEEIGGGAAGAGATLVALAVRRAVVDRCERQPRTHKKANHNVPVPNDGHDWAEVPGETEQPGGSTPRNKTTELPMDEARKLHERLKHVSYKQMGHDVLGGDILEAYQLVVAGCSKCRRASCDTEEIPKGKGSEKGTCKSRGACRIDPDECIHPAGQLTTVGTNQHQEKVHRRLCDALLVDRDAKWWSEEQELRAEVQAIRPEKQKRELLSRSRAPTAGRSTTG
ncbi:unnamed protein product [Prorocentrum cordatum]|uniref:Uncharacterized protein n=1 Tax=Prorocentrum cordatum TaxID=2364126 RepID=A0ABN9TMH5_9DINO|nr:unnamed protein product [Polarella glacialis]